MQYLEQLITEQTPIVHLKTNWNFHKKQLQELNSNEHGMTNDMTIHGYYFKKRQNKPYYLIFLIDELLGSYLASMRNLPTVQYQVAEKHEKYGVASKNFKISENTYYKLEQLRLIQGKKYNISRLKLFCNGPENRDQLEKHLLDTVALDLYMLQLDRSSNNLQFQKNKLTGYFDLAPLYDYECSAYKLSFTKLYLEHCLIDICLSNLKYLGKCYPYFKECLEFWMQQSMCESWNHICEKFHFHQNCSAYDFIASYYEQKDKSQKILLQKVLKSIS